MSTLFLIFEKGDQEKNCVLDTFKICKFNFFLYLKKGISKKIGLCILRFVIILFLVFEKGDQRKNWARSF